MLDDPTHSARRELLRSLRAHLEWQRDCGAPWLPRRPVASVAAPPPGRAGAGTSAAPPPSPPARTAELFAEPGLRAADTLETLRAHIGDCQRCQLAGGRTNLVFGVGDPRAALMFVGEGPGGDEDLQGEPFVGRAGQLLTEIITKGMKLRRQDVYIANVVKCRPPGNRNPEPDEIAHCMPFLSRQIELVQPRVIVALGTFAAQTLLDVKTPITRMRGTWHDYRGVKVMPTFHPAYLLRSPGEKRLVWADIKLVMGELGLPRLMRRSLAIVLWLAPLLLGATPTPTVTPAPAAAGPSGAVLLLVVDGMINPASADYIRDGIAAGAERGAAAVVVQLDTPGGLLESTKLIVKDMLSAAVPVIVYVAPSGAGATSAGVFVTMAANLAAMAPGTNIGAAHPVGGQGENIDGDLREKMENFTASLGRTIAQQRGRNVEWAEKAVRDSVSVTEREAVKLKIVDFVADSVDDLLAKANGRTVEVRGQKVVLNTAGAPVQRFEMRLRQRLLDLLANPNVAYLLMMAGLLGLYVEFTSPGVVFPGVAGAICLLLAAAALQVLPINYSGLALIGLGVAMLAAEAFLPSFGVIGVGGIVAFVLGSLLLFDTPDSTMRVDRGLIAGAALTLGTFTLVVAWLVVRSQRQRSSVGAEGMVGERGQVRRVLVPGRKVKVFVHGEYWDAETDEPLEIGDTVQVAALTGLHMRVRRADR